MLPRVLIIGGPDVDARLDLMRALADEYAPAAAGSDPSLGPTFDRAGFPYFSYPLQRPTLVADLRALVALGRLLRRYRPQLVHAFDARPGVYGCLAASLTGVPAVIGTIPGLGSLYVDGGPARRGLRAAYEALQTWAARRSDRTVFQNRDDLEEFVTRRIVPREKAVVIPGSGVRTDLLDPARVSPAQRRELRASLGIAADAPLVTLVSRVIRTKGVAEFAAAARAVRQIVPASRFLLVGGADPDSVDRLTPAELAELGGAVHWAGPRRDVPSILAASDVFVYSSYLREGIPRALLEAAAMGLPLVTTDTPGCKEVVEDGVNGFRVPARDAAALARAVLRLLAEPDLRERFGPESRRRAVSLFDLSVVVEQTRALYGEVLSPAPSLSSFRARRTLSGAHQAGAKRRGGGKEQMFQAVKRTLDVVIAGAALVLTGPLILAGAAAVKLTSPGPAFYRARRAGRDGRPFTMFKLRTMRVGADTPDRKITADADDRITPVGRLLRRFKLDELPQLWNVLRGDMSLVGPRPEDWDLVQQHYTAEQRRTLLVRPGLASPADVRWYPDLTYHDPPPAGVSIQDHYLRRHLPAQVAEALRYVERPGLTADARVLGQLVFCVLVRSWLPPPRRPLTFREDT
jgi:lipopolysaccharide/colanic/teichoic acid biosynthesis glycosyltransferase/glycosyltransferase involved in cell wall biosynthesis